MIRKQSTADVGFSVVHCRGVRHIFAAAVPRSGTTLREQTHDALRTIEAVIREEGVLGSIVHQAVFLRDFNDRDECRDLISGFYGKELPATSYIMQPPCDGKLVAIEAMGLGGAGDEVRIERLGERLVVTHHEGLTWAHLANVSLRMEFQKVYDLAIHEFSAMREALALREMRFDQVVRTWLYLGDIVGAEGDTQRYKELNRARTDFYQDLQFGRELLPKGWNKPVYPASTGIGTEGKDLVMSAIALATQRADVRLLPLENPLQTAACDYGVCYSPQSPKFARAMAIVSPDCATTFVSGTASITASETRHEDDAVAQTQQTLDNIAALISEENFSAHGEPGHGGTLDDLALARVYIKRQEDYAKVRAVCQSRLGEMPTVYAIADVCRPDLLVEIEGVAFSEAKT